MGRLRKTAVHGLFFFGLSALGIACGADSSAPSAESSVQASSPDDTGLAFTETSTTVARTTALPTTAPPVAGINLGLQFVLEPSAGLDLGLGDLPPPTTAAATTTTPFVLDLSQITDPSTSLEPIDPIITTNDSPFCVAAAYAHGLISGPGSGTTAMSVYAEALDAVVEVAPTEVLGYYAKLADFTHRIDEEGSYPGASNDAAAIFDAQVEANAFIEATCGFRILT